MKSAPTLLLLSGALLLGACTTNQGSGESAQTSTAETAASAAATVPFTEARNYFVNNTYPDSDLHSVVLTSQAEFDKVFGMAPTMGANGQPTPIDFARQHVVAVIAKTSNLEPQLTAGTLTQTGNGLTLTYRLTEGPAGSAYLRPAILLVVDNQYQGDVKLQPQ